MDVAHISQEKNIQKQCEKYVKKLELEYEKKLQTKLLEDRKKTMDAFIKFKPELEKEIKSFYDKLVQPIEQKENDAEKKNKPIILDEFIHEGTKYYKDDMGCVWNTNAEPIGSIEHDNGHIKCILFNDNSFNDDNAQLPTLNN